MAVRDLTNYDWYESNSVDEKACDVFINFDDDAIPSGIKVTGFVMSATYQLIEGEHEDRVAGKVKLLMADGYYRHNILNAGDSYGNPHVEGLLPSLDLVVSMLVTAESVLLHTHETLITKYNLVFIWFNWAGLMKEKALILVGVLLAVLFLSPSAHLMNLRIQKPTYWS